MTLEEALKVAVAIGQHDDSETAFPVTEAICTRLNAAFEGEWRFEALISAYTDDDRVDVVVIDVRTA